MDTPIGNPDPGSLRRRRAASGGRKTKVHLLGWDGTKSVGKDKELGRYDTPLQERYNTPRYRTPNRQSPGNANYEKKSLYGLLAKVPWGVFQRCVGTTLEPPKTNMEPKSPGGVGRCISFSGKRCIFRCKLLVFGGGMLHICMCIYKIRLYNQQDINIRPMFV